MTIQVWMKPFIHLMKECCKSQNIHINFCFLMLELRTDTPFYCYGVGMYLELDLKLL